MIRTVYPETLYAPRILRHVWCTPLEQIPLTMTLPFVCRRAQNCIFTLHLPPPPPPHPSPIPSPVLVGWLHGGHEKLRQKPGISGSSSDSWLCYLGQTLISSQPESFHLQNRITKPSWWDCCRDWVNSPSMCTWPALSTWITCTKVNVSKLHLVLEIHGICHLKTEKICFLSDSYRHYPKVRVYKHLCSVAILRKPIR